jgi:hypothetical protein
MIAVLLYLVGLVAVFVTLVLIGSDYAALYASLTAAFSAETGNILPALSAIAAKLNWALTPFLGGLLLMGFARVMMLLGSINRALRGPA